MDDSRITDNSKANTLQQDMLIFFIPPLTWKMVLNTWCVGQSGLAGERGREGVY